MIVFICLDFPVFIPNEVAISRGSCPIPVTTIDPLAKQELFLIDVRQRKMRHVEFSEEWFILRCLLVIPQAEAKEGHLIAVAIARLRREMPGVIPPLSFKIRVRIVVCGERKLSAGEGELIGELTLTLPSPWKGEGQN